MAITDNDLRTTKYLLKQGGGLVTNKNVADDILNDFRRLVLAVNAVVGGGDLAITMGLGRDVDATGTINAFDGSNSIDVNNRTLSNSSSEQTIDWDNSILNAISASTPKTSIDWNNRVLYSITGSFVFPSVDYNTGRLIVPDGTVTVDWGTGRLRDLGNITTIDWNTQRLFNAPFGSETLNWSQNKLTGTWKTTETHVLGVALSSTGRLQFENSATPNNVEIISGATSTPYVLTLPTALGSAGQVLTDVLGDGVLSWTTVAGGAGSLADTLGVGRDVDATGTINTSGSSLAMNVNTRTLYNSDGTLAVRWQNRYLSDSSSTISVDWQTKTLSDAADISVDWGNRTLVEETNGDVTLNWDTRKTYDSQGTPKQSIDWNGRVLSDLTEVPAINWGTRVASDSTGTISIDWSNTKRQLYDFSGVLSVYWGNRAMYDTTGTVISIHYGDRILRDHLSDVSMTWGTSRRLRAAAAAVIAGSGDVLDWTSCWLKDLSNVEALNWNAKSITGTWKYLDGNQAASKVLTSDASGNMSWQTPAGGGASLAATLAVGRDVDATGTIKTFTDEPAIAINSRALKDSLNNDSILWEGRSLVRVDGTQTVNWETYTLNDNNGAPTVEWDAKEFRNPNGGFWKYIDGNEGAGKVMQSDANGNMSWQTPAAGANIYTANGALTANRTVTQATFDMLFTGGKFTSIDAGLDYTATFVNDDIAGISGTWEDAASGVLNRMQVTPTLSRIEYTNTAGNNCQALVSNAGASLNCSEQVGLSGSQVLASSTLVRMFFDDQSGAPLLQTLQIDGAGIKIGTLGTALVGFYGATPIVRGASVADATDAATAITQLNLLISRIEALGLIATV